MHHSPILDYASPASRGKLRLPARSVIAVDHRFDHPASLTVHERLDGRANAVLALLLAAFTFCTMIAVEKQMLRKWWRNQESLVLLGVIQAAELVVGAKVVNSTWRRTRLTVTPADVTLVFAAPFSPARRYHWPAEQLAAVEVIDSEPLLNNAVVPELELRMWTGAPVRLFAGHPREELVELAGMIKSVQPPLPTTAGAAALPPTAPVPHPHRLGEW